jgi:sugar lactone lactonase YvrE
VLLQVFTAVSPALSYPTGLTLDLVNQELYVADYYNSRLVAFPFLSSPLPSQPSTASATLCIMMYSLPGNVDYPWY